MPATTPSSLDKPVATAAITSPTASDASQRHSTRSRVFVCPEPGCGGRFHRKFTLHEHIKTHTGEKPYECPIKSCGKRFGTSGNLSRHRRLHMEKTLLCPVLGCGRTFAKPAKFERHLKIHMGSAAHACNFPGCAKTFSTSGNLLRHQRTQHRNYSIPKAQWHCPAAVLPAMLDSTGTVKHELFDSLDLAYRPHFQTHDHYTHMMKQQFDAASDIDVLDLLEGLLTDGDDAMINASASASRPMRAEPSGYCSDDASLRELFIAV